MPSTADDRPMTVHDVPVTAPAAAPPPADDLSEFYSMFTGAGHKFAISRTKPKSAMIKGKLRTVAGHLETIDEPPSPDYIGEVWGGRTVEIVGDPRIKPEKLMEEDVPAAPQSNHDPALVQRMYDEQAAERKRLEERLERERERSERIAAERASGPDPAMWQSTVGVIQSTADNMVATLRDQLARRDAELTELRREIHARPATDTEMMKLIERRAQEDSARLTEAHRRELEAERREHEQSVAMLERLHRSEVENLKALHQQQVDSMRTSHDQQMELQRVTNQQQLERLEADLAEAREKGEKAERRSGSGASDENGKAAFWRSMKDEVIPRVVPVITQAASAILQPRRGVMLPMRPMVPMLPVGPMRPLAPPPGPARVAAMQGATVARSPASPGMAQAAGAAPRPQGASRFFTQSAQEMERKVGALETPITRPALTPPADQALVKMMAERVEFFETAIRNGTSPSDFARTLLSTLPAQDLDLLARIDMHALQNEIDRVLGPDRIILAPAGRAFLAGVQEVIRNRKALANG